MSNDNKHVEKEFDGWHESGVSKNMENNHFYLWEAIMKNGNFKEDSLVLDLCCGEGWAALETAKKLKKGFVVGVDISSAMIDEAVKRRDNAPNSVFFSSAVQHFAFGAEQFSHVYSIEAIYYIKELKETMEKVYNSLKPGGYFITAIDYYRENPYTSCWQKEVGIPMYSHSTDHYVNMFKEIGFTDIETGRIKDPSPLPDTYEGKWFKGIDELRGFHTEGSLLLIARK